jgi:hypothetical protein
MCGVTALNDEHRLQVQWNITDENDSGKKNHGLTGRRPQMVLVASAEPGRPRPLGGTAWHLHHVGPTDAPTPDPGLTGKAAQGLSQKSVVGVASAVLPEVAEQIARQPDFPTAMQSDWQVEQPVAAGICQSVLLRFPTTLTLEIGHRFAEAVHL